MGRYVTHTSWLPDSVGASRLIFGLSSTAMNTATLNNFIVRREGMIDTYLGHRWTPSDYATAPTVRLLSQDMVTFDVYNTLYNQDGTLQDKPNVTENYELALALLNDLRDGKGTLYNSDGNRIQERDLSRKYWIRTKDYVQTFDEGDTLDMRVSPTKLDDLFDDKQSDD